MRRTVPPSAEIEFNGYFTIHNLGFKPRSDRTDYLSAQDSVGSDVDVVGYHPRKHV